MSNQELQTTFWEQEDFSYDIILELLQAQDRVTLHLSHIWSSVLFIWLYFSSDWIYAFFCVIFHQSIHLEAGHALALFAYNNPKQQKAIAKTRGVSMQAFETFLGSDDESERAKAAFQVSPSQISFISFIYDFCFALWTLVKNQETFIAIYSWWCT